MERFSHFVLFGATGDLAHSKMYPALFDLYQNNALPADFAFLGMAFDDLSVTEFQRQVQKTLEAQYEASEHISEFVSMLAYAPVDFGEPATVEDTIAEHADTENGRFVFYLAIPPAAFETVSLCVKRFQETYCDCQLRVVVEKPFGQDLESAKHLNNTLREFLYEEQIYRMDHYLGKETVQNILALRFGNSLFEPLLNNRYVQNIELDLIEEEGIGERAGYFDGTGIIKDVLQNHILQVLSLLMMEPPVQIQSNFVRDEKHKFLASLAPLDLSSFHLGQYGSNENGEMNAYQEEPDVPEDSQTETYVSMQMGVKNMRWDGVPVYVRTGKRLNEKKTEIRVTFHPSFQYFVNQKETCNPAPNVLVIRIQPNEEVYYTVNAKFPGEGMCIQPVKLHFTYQESFNVPIQDAYTRLLKDAIEGDQTLFIRSDEIEAAWEYVTPVLEAKENGNLKPEKYTSGNTIEDVEEEITEAGE